MSRDEELWRDRLQTATRSVSVADGELEDFELFALTVLAHPDPGRVGERAVLTDLAAGRSVAVSRLEPRFAQPRGGPPRPLADPRLSRKPWHLVTEADGGVGLDPSAVCLTADGAAVTSRRVLTPEELRRGVVLVIARHVTLLFHVLKTLPGIERIAGIVGESAAMLHVYRETRRVADLDFPVLLRGESGTGKELVARALHDAGPRCDRPFLAVNVAAIPATLAAAELFGAARGAYSGADRRRHGYFHRADGGTLFLDEIGEIPFDVQVLLLRVLESGQIQPVGADTLQSVDVRVVSATDADLEAAVERGRFSASLFHRLTGYEVMLPALRDRREDFGRLFYHFLVEELAALGEGRRLCAVAPDERPWVDAELVARLATYAWPGNVRQLRNAVRQLAVGSRGEPRMELAPKVARMLETTASPVSSPEPESAPQPRRVAAGDYRDPDQVDETLLRRTLARHHFEPTPTAEELGVSRASLYNLMTRYGIRKAAELDRDEVERCRDRDGTDLDAMAEHLQVSKRGLKIRMKDLGMR